jgi:hypothetical protein
MGSGSMNMEEEELGIWENEKSLRADDSLIGRQALLNT